MMVLYDFEVPYEAVHRIGLEAVEDSIKKLLPHYEEIKLEKFINRQVYRIRVTTREESPMSDPEILFELQKELKEKVEEHGKADSVFDVHGAGDIRRAQDYDAEGG